MSTATLTAGAAPATASKPKGKKKDIRVEALVRFASAITIFNLIGHLFLGFEQAWLQPFAALAGAYFTELLLETVEAAAQKRKARYRGGLKSFILFLLPAHISAMAISMLLYANDRMWPLAFAAAVAIASKYIFRVTASGKSKHFLNPSNFGITMVLILFPWIGIAMPYMFTENLMGWHNWILPVVIIISGSLLNTVYTKKMPLIFAWCGMFAAQAIVRATYFETPVPASLAPMTGVAFLLFTFYMVSDPSTTPRSKGGQAAFGASVALVYGALLTGHVVFTLFFALTLVCVVRGAALYTANLWASRREAEPTSSGPRRPMRPRLEVAGSFPSVSQSSRLNLEKGAS
ncbi:MAG: enediyne biosynthesis protein UnbU [Acidobacteriota bacterium]